MTDEFKAQAAKRKSQKLAYRNPMPLDDALTNTAKLDHHIVEQPISLHTELVPKTCWLSNVRDHLTAKEWSEVKDWCYRRAKYRCEICGETGIGQRSRKWNVEYLGINPQLFSNADPFKISGDNRYGFSFLNDESACDFDQGTCFTLPGRTDKKMEAGTKRIMHKRNGIHDFFGSPSINHALFSKLLG